MGNNSIFSLFKSSFPRTATREDLEDAEEELGKPDAAEAADLATHVRKCAQRWSVLNRQNKELMGDMLLLANGVETLRVFLLVLVLLALINTSSNVGTMLLNILAGK